MYWMDWLSNEDAVDCLRRQLPNLVAVSNKSAITEVFCRLSAQACMQEGESALYEMADVLRNLLREPNRQIKRNRFHRL